jgi:hypothetical protein
MVGVHDFALLSEGGAENADRVRAVGLDFEVNGAERLHDGYTIHYIQMCVNIVLHIVWLHMKHKTEAKPLRNRTLARFNKNKMRIVAFEEHTNKKVL